MVAKSKRTLSRKVEKEQQIKTALEKVLPKEVDLVVIGSGASGITAAITAAEAGLNVAVLEHDLLPFKRILATGNGRCNFSTVSLEPKRYNNPDFVDAVFGKNPLDKILSFFRDAGLSYALEEDRLYPQSRQAASLRSVLLRRANTAGVNFFCLREVTALTKQESLWTINCKFALEDVQKSEQIHAKACVIATGSVTNWLKGNDLGLNLSDFEPMLCPLECKDYGLSALDGRRVRAKVSLYEGMFPSWQEIGEVLFRSFGLSGIVIFDASRRAHATNILRLDLAPDASIGELMQIAWKTIPKDVDPNYRSLLGAFDGVLDPEIAKVLLDIYEKNEPLAYTPFEEKKPQELADGYLEGFIHFIKDVPLQVVKKTQLASSQVARGGLACEQFRTDDLQAKDPALAGLFATGEALDIDGDCGGFNLSWAWISGLIAGNSLVTYVKTN